MNIYAITWRAENPEGFRWYIRGLKGDGSFYGDLRLHGTNGQCVAGTSVQGRLTPLETLRMIAALDIIMRETSPMGQRTALGVLFQRKSPTNAGDVNRLFEYQGRDAPQSDAAQAFLDIINLIEPHLATYSKMLSEFRDTSF